ncbi:MAG: hypothetical protein D6725_17355 [Planctomycetota bacterium]|nr:MAG: hypothetical protein D6725_17355 [Planctomycetota bacterium]
MSGGRTAVSIPDGRLHPFRTERHNLFTRCRRRTTAPRRQRWHVPEPKSPVCRWRVPIQRAWAAANAAPFNRFAQLPQATQSHHAAQAARRS